MSTILHLIRARKAEAVILGAFVFAVLGAVAWGTPSVIHRLAHPAGPPGNAAMQLPPRSGTFSPASPASTAPAGSVPSSRPPLTVAQVTPHAPRSSAAHSSPEPSSQASPSPSGTGAAPSSPAASAGAQPGVTATASATAPATASPSPSQSGGGGLCVLGIVCLPL